MTPLLELASVSQRFGPTLALDGVSLALLAGTVHAIVGENGAGKSTLLRIVCGAISDYRGEVRLAGARVRLASPEAARRAGIATIHQELALVGALSVEDNLLLARERGSLFGWLARRERRRAAERMLAALELDVDPATPLEALPLATQQLVEVARALGDPGLRVLVMDEPTSALTTREAAALVTRVRALAARGIGVLYVSHRLPEVAAIADEVSILCDGRRVASLSAGLDEHALSAALMGVRAGAAPAPKDSHAIPSAKDARDEHVRAAPAALVATPRLRVTGLGLAGREKARPRLADVSFELAAGEILGVAGLGGSGSEWLVGALAGRERLMRPAMQLDGVPFAPRDVGDALGRGVAMLAPERRHSVFGELSIAANASLSALASLSRAGFVRRRAERARVAAALADVALGARSQALPARALSGGNQQKLGLARVLLARPKVLLLDDPTRGVDLGAKRDIHALLRTLAARGMAILVVASELEELAVLCGRILALGRGRIVARFDAPPFDLSALALAVGADAARPHDGALSDTPASASAREPHVARVDP